MTDRIEFEGSGSYFVGVTTLGEEFLAISRKASMPAGSKSVGSQPEVRPDPGMDKTSAYSHSEHMCSIKMYPARNGDAFLISSRAPSSVAILIDGGYAATFDQHICDDLGRFAKAGRCLDLVIATHIDADHIAGLLAFFKKNGHATRPNVIGVRHVMHNSMRSLQANSGAGGKQAISDRDILEEIRRRGYPKPKNKPFTPSEISVREGSSLAALLLGGGYCWNSKDGNMRVDSTGYPGHEINASSRVKVIGPAPARLEALCSWWIRELRRLGFIDKIGKSEKFDDAFEFLCAAKNFSAVAQPGNISHRMHKNRELADAYLPDDSLTNASSISLILEVNSIRLLFLADSWASDTEQALKSLKPSKAPLIFDAIKLSHHGSLRNTSPALLELIDSPRYLISSNGEQHDHPSIEVLKAIVDRPATFSRKLFFNYKTAASRELSAYSSRSKSQFEVHENHVDWIDIDPNNHYA